MKDLNPFCVRSILARGKETSMVHTATSAHRLAIGDLVNV